MKSSTIWLSPVGATIIAIGFFLPWFQVSCQPNLKKAPLATIEVSGYQLATGKKPDSIKQLYDSFLTGMMIKNFIKRMEKKTRHKVNIFPKRWLLWGILGCCLLIFILGFQIASDGSSFSKKLLGTFLSIAMLGFLLAGLMQHAPKGFTQQQGQPVKLPDSIIFGLGHGGMMLIGGFILMFLGFWLVPSKPKKEQNSP